MHCVMLAANGCCLSALEKLPGGRPEAPRRWLSGDSVYPREYGYVLAKASVSPNARGVRPPCIAAEVGARIGPPCTLWRFWALALLVVAVLIRLVVLDLVAGAASDARSRSIPVLALASVGASRSRGMSTRIHSLLL